jgi:multidrug efflux pump subunit AcrA (membrane-fusion protein)
VGDSGRAPEDPERASTLLAVVVALYAVVLETRRGALLVPQPAIQQRQDLYQVGVVTPDERIKIRTVKVGPRHGAQWLIDGGLKVGERVVVDGLVRVKAREKVRPVPAP